MARIRIQIPINPNLLVPQPPGGWRESPINEDGTIKEQYRRKGVSGKTQENRNSSGKTQENSKRAVEMSAKDSAKLTKESIEYLKKHNIFIFE